MPGILFFDHPRQPREALIVGHVGDIDRHDGRYRSQLGLDDWHRISSRKKPGTAGSGEIGSIWRPPHQASGWAGAEHAQAGRRKSRQTLDRARFPPRPAAVPERTNSAFALAGAFVIRTRLANIVRPIPG